MTIRPQIRTPILVTLETDMVELASDRRVYTIGRYEVAGHLATGGMAEILLGRVVGPMGFERPVVIKRILPHLARDHTFVQMFLDEARIAARIRHPNVVQVQELLEEDGELFIVMEYLDGESLSGVTRRLARQDRVMPPALCAHVIAQAAFGLHSAHELTDDDGTPVHLVHRDISPQNIFITYDGVVKVLDFGIAKGEDRMTKTETGHLKGKFEYMSPEQCTAKSLDRRSDIFSLGTVLWETATGRRLFKRANQLLTLRAILDAPMKSPREYRPEFPPSLEQVAMRALNRKRKDRYQTAAEFRRALLTAGQHVAPDTFPDEALRELMHQLFEERIIEKKEMLGRLRSGSALTHLPAPEVDPAIELPTVAGEEELEDPSEGTEEHSVVVARDTLAEFAAPKRKRGILFAAGLGLLVLAGGVAFMLVGPDANAEPTDLAAGPDLETTAAAVGPVSPRPTPPTKASPLPEDVARYEAVEPHTPAEVTIHINTNPPGARVLAGRELLGRTPGDFAMPASDDEVTLTLTMRRYQDRELTFVPDVDKHFLDVDLRRIRDHHSTAMATPMAAPTTNSAPTMSGSPYDRFR